MVQLVLVPDRVERLVPGRQDFPGGEIEVVRGVLVPFGPVGAVAVDLAVARAGQRHEEGRPERLPVRACVSLADRPRGYLAPGQIWHVVTATGCAVPPRWLGGEHVSAHP